MDKGKIVQTIQHLIKAVIYTLVPVVGLVLVTANSSLLFGVRSYVVQTGSMEPKIPVGSLIFSLPQKTYELGDIVLFNDKESRTVAHRVSQVLIKNGRIAYQTKGDANNSPDTVLQSEGFILGREFFLIPSIGKLGAIIKTVPGFILILGLPSLLFIIFELKNIKNEIEAQAEKRIKERLGVAHLI